MKKLFIILALPLVAMTSWAQEGTMEPLNEYGTYELKQIVTVEEITASSLYVRALEALSDWTGTLEKSKMGVDVQDKDEGLVVYKGNIFLGFKYYSKFAGAGWDCFADCTVKIKCKDGRSQITLSIPSMSFLSTQGTNISIPLSDFYPEYKYDGSYKLKQAGQTALDIPRKAHEALYFLSERIAKGSPDDF